MTRSLRLACALVLAAGGTTRAQITGTIQYTDETGATHPSRQVTVKGHAIVPHPTIPHVMLDVEFASVETDFSGNYTFPTPPSDAVGVFAFAHAGGAAGNVCSYGITTPTYSLGCAVGGVSTFGNTSDAERAFAVYDSLVTGQHFASLVRDTPTAPLRCQFPFPTTVAPATSYYGSSHWDGTTYQVTNNIHILRADRWDWDINLHEYSHYLAKLDHLDNNPGDSHAPGISNIGQPLTPPPDGPGGFRTKDNGMRVAWGEGLATFNGIAMQRVDAATQNLPGTIPRVGDDEYRDTLDNTLRYSLETHFINIAARPEIGEADELSVMRILWDIADPANEPKDRVSRGFERVYRDLAGIYVPPPAGSPAGTAPVNPGPRTLFDVWKHYTATSTYPEIVDLGAIFEEYSVSPLPTGGIGSVTAMTAPAPTFTWISQNNGANETFGLMIFDDSWNRLLNISIPGTGALAYTLSAAEWATLTALAGTLGPMDLKFVVTGSDLFAPDGTTPYMSPTTIPLVLPIETTGAYWSDAYGFQVIPSPGVLALVGVGGLIGLRRRRRAASV